MLFGQFVPTKYVLFLPGKKKKKHHQIANKDKKS